MLFVRQGHYHVADISFQHVDVFFLNDFTSDAMVYSESEIKWKRIPVSENIFHHAPVCSGCHGVEILVISDLIYV